MESGKVPSVAPDLAEMTIEELRARVLQLEEANAAMSPIVLRVAEARMCRDATTMVESCPYCSLTRGVAAGYSGQHDAACMVTRARALNF